MTTSLPFTTYYYYYYYLCTSTTPLFSTYLNVRTTIFTNYYYYCTATSQPIISTTNHIYLHVQQEEMLLFTQYSHTYIHTYVQLSSTHQYSLVVDVSLTKVSAMNCSAQMYYKYAHFFSSEHIKCMFQYSFCGRGRDNFPLTSVRRTRSFRSNNRKAMKRQLQYSSSSYLAIQALDICLSTEPVDNFHLL